MDLAWKTLAKRTVYTAPILTVTMQKAQPPENAAGGTKEFVVIDAADWVITVPLLKRRQAKDLFGINEDCFLLVEQWRHGIQKPSFEFPGGVIDKGEKPEQAAARELAEETGFCANTLIPLASMSPNPALFSNTVHFFAAHDLMYQHAENPDEDEFLRSTAVPLQQINKKIGQPPYVHALMAAALCLYNNRFS